MTDTKQRLCRFCGKATKMRETFLFVPGEGNVRALFCQEHARIATERSRLVRGLDPKTGKRLVMR